MNENLKKDPQHTPGPWTFTTEGGDRYIRSEDGKFSACDMNYYPWIGGNDADWNLIAAAPELLEALKESVADAEKAANPSARMYGYDKAKAAIAKAEGHQ